MGRRDIQFYPESTQFFERIGDSSLTGRFPNCNLLVELPEGSFVNTLR
jgi:hypothetical protein